MASNRAPEDGEMADALDRLGKPTVVTLSALAAAADQPFREWLLDRRNARKVPHRMEECGYRAVRNPTTSDGRWKVSGRNSVIYAHRDLSIRDGIEAAERYSEGAR